MHTVFECGYYFYESYRVLKFRENPLLVCTQGNGIFIFCLFPKRHPVYCEIENPYLLETRKIIISLTMFPSLPNIPPYSRQFANRPISTVASFHRRRRRRSLPIYVRTVFGAQVICGMEVGMGIPDL